jgi:4-hydroxybenzoate polyprenyltransferase
MSRRPWLFALKSLALLSSVRWYNVLLLALAQYLASVFVLSPPSSLWQFALDYKLHLLVLSTSLVVSAGFILNGFYDIDKDLVNRPLQTAFERLVSRRTSLNLYLIFNFTGLVLASVLSWRAVAFFASYAMALWLYSHKFKKLAYLGNLSAALLSFVPFFALLLYYRSFHPGLISYVGFLFTIELARQLVKDVEGMKGDLIYGYPTIPALEGRSGLKAHFMGLLGLSSATAAWHLWIWKPAPQWGMVVFGLLLIIAALWSIPPSLHQARSARRLHLGFKLCMVLGVLSLARL